MSQYPSAQGSVVLESFTYLSQLHDKGKFFVMLLNWPFHCCAGLDAALMDVRISPMHVHNYTMVKWTRNIYSQRETLMAVKCTKNSAMVGYTKPLSENGMDLVFAEI